MSKQDFIRSLRVARSLMEHWVVHYPGLDSNSIEEDFARADLWLSPASVRGFDPTEFPELSERVRAELQVNVDGFRDVAAQVPLNGPATLAQAEAGRKYLNRILQIMEPYLANTQEVRALQDAMKEVRFPKTVRTWEYEFGRDSSGDPAVWIWIVVDDTVADDATFAAETTRLSREIREAMRKVASNRWPYVRFRTVSEQRSLQAAHA